MDVGSLINREIICTHEKRWVEGDVEQCEVFLEIEGIGLLAWPQSAFIEIAERDEIRGMERCDPVRGLLFEDSLTIKGVWQRTGGDYGYGSPVLFEMANDYWLELLASAPASMHAVGIQPRHWRDIRRERKRVDHDIIQLA